MDRPVQLLRETNESYNHTNRHQRAKELTTAQQRQATNTRHDSDIDVNQRFQCRCQRTAVRLRPDVSITISRIDCFKLSNILFFTTKCLNLADRGDVFLKVSINCPDFFARFVVQSRSRSM